MIQFDNLNEAVQRWQRRALGDKSSFCTERGDRRENCKTGPKASRFAIDFWSGFSLRFDSICRPPARSRQSLLMPDPCKVVPRRVSGDGSVLRSTHIAALKRAMAPSARGGGDLRAAWSPVSALDLQLSGIVRTGLLSS